MKHICGASWKKNASSNYPISEEGPMTLQRDASGRLHIESNLMGESLMDKQLLARRCCRF